MSLSFHMFCLLCSSSKTATFISIFSCEDDSELIGEWRQLLGWLLQTITSVKLTLMSVHFQMHRRSVDIYPSAISDFSVKHLSENISTWRVCAIRRLSLDNEGKDQRSRSAFSPKCIQWKLFNFLFGLFLLCCKVVKVNHKQTNHRRCILNLATPVLWLVDSRVLCHVVNLNYLRDKNFLEMGAESRQRGPMGDWGVPREPINPLCSPPEQCHGQQSHTSWRLSHRRLQTPCSLRCHSQHRPKLKSHM